VADSDGTAPQSQPPRKKRPAPPHAWKKGQSGNPGGKTPITEAERECARILREASPTAARKVLALCDSSDERVALGAAKAILDKVLPDRLDGAALAEASNPLATLTPEQLVGLVRATRDREEPPWQTPQ